MVNCGLRMPTPPCACPAGIAHGANPAQGFALWGASLGAAAEDRLGLGDALWPQGQKPRAAFDQGAVMGA